MLTIWGAKQPRFCDRLTRRGFLQIGAVGGALTLADIMRSRATAGQTSPKAVIMVYLMGGPSHIDMYDLKPNAPVEYRGEFNPIRTNVPGLDICELMPRQARIADKLALIRSIEAVHEHSDAQVMTGYGAIGNTAAQHPSFGAVISKLRSARGANVPPYVTLYKVPAPFNGGESPGYLGAAHGPFLVPSSFVNTLANEAARNLVRAKGVTATRLEERQALLASFDSLRRDLDTNGQVQALDTFTTRALSLVTSGAVAKALDLSREDPRTLDRYREVEDFLRARRLVEAGVGCVTMAYVRTLGVVSGWDTHFDNFKCLRAWLPILDRGIANLIQDLHDRGLDEDVVTIVWGEFGRSPKIDNNGGRNHWPQVMSALIAGGGLKMGQVVGSTGERAEYPKERKYRVPQVLSTLYRALGIDPGMTFPDSRGRPVAILDDREPVTELL